jgi:hypothetical protein
MLENLLHELRIAYITLQSGSATTESKVARPQQRVRKKRENKKGHARPLMSPLASMPTIPGRW